MTIEELKSKIENKTLDDKLIIFKLSDDNDFIVNQYLNEIIKFKKLSIDYDFDLSDAGQEDIFGAVDNSIKIIRNPSNNLEKDLVNTPNLYIIISDNKITIDEELIPYVVIIPKLEDWQIKDYAYSLAEGVSKNKLDNLIEVCKKDIYRLDQELNKIKIFTKDEQPYVFDMCEYEGIFSDLSNHNIFDFTNALIRKDIPTFIALYKEIENIDVEPLALITIMYRQVKNLIMVQLNPNPTEQNTQLSAKQIWAIKKYNTGIYTKQELYKAFDILTDVDRRIKVGEMPMENRGADFMRDYIITKILG